MIKNQLYPYIEEYIKSFLYVFKKEQLDVGLVNGQIKFENLNLRPDSINNELDRNNIPFWLKAGLISKIQIGCSLMNFIGEKPIEINMEGINIILTPSYKWIIQNLDSFLYEDATEIKNEYSPYENNSMNIFGKKINVLDNSIFNKDKFEKFFKDQTLISNYLNSLLLDCFHFYYSKNYSLILKLKNIHIRFEDDQLINYMDNIALGCKIDLFELTLSSEGTMKKNNFKITKFDFYWENNAHILIPSNILYDSIKNGSLNDSYYTNLKKIKFENFSYKNDTKFIVKNLNCLCNYGIKAINQGKMDLFGKKENNYKLYIQFASNEIKINFFPDLEIIRNNFKKFVREFTILGQAQEFKPMKKPYNSKNRDFIEILKQINKNKNSKLAKKFTYKRKMMIRDWLYYFYWCHKCQTSIYNFNSNPLRLEFIRFYNLLNKENDIDKLTNLGNNLKKNKTTQSLNEDGKPIWTKENPNPDNINLLFNVDIKIKGINLNLYPFISSKNNSEFISIKINNCDMKVFLNKEKYELLFSIKNINLGPNKLNSGEKVIISKNSIRKKDTDLNDIDTKKNINLYNNKTLDRRININYGNYFTVNDIDSNTGINGLLKKYNPNFSQQLNMIDKAMKTINRSSTIEEDKKSNQSQNNKNGKNEIFKKANTKLNLYAENHFEKNKNNNFTKSIIQNYEPSNIVQKMELKKQQNDFNISQAINHYNNNKTFHRNNSKNSENDSILSNTNDQKNNSSNTFNYNINNTRIQKSQNARIIPTGKVIPLNLFELYSDTNNNNNNNNPSFQFKYTKINKDSSVDAIKIVFGVIRFNLFPEYILKCANILNDYKSMNKKTKIKSIKNDLISEKDLFLENKLLEMQNYFLEKLNKIPDNKKTKQIKNYITYLQNEINKRKMIYHETYNNEINYLFSIFSKGIDISIDYDNLECIIYNAKNNKICGKAIVPPPMFNFKFNSSNISFKLYDFEFELNDLENTNILFKSLKTIIEDKFKMTQLLIEPCMTQIKKELEENEKILEEKSLLKLKKEFNDYNQINKNYKENNDKYKGDLLEEKIIRSPNGTIEDYSKLNKNNLQENEKENRNNQENQEFELNKDNQENKEKKQNNYINITKNGKSNKRNILSREIEIIRNDSDYYRVEKPKEKDKININKRPSINETQDGDNKSLNLKKAKNSNKNNIYFINNNKKLKSIEKIHGNKIINKSTNPNITSLNNNIFNENKIENLNKENKNGKKMIGKKNSNNKVMNNKTTDENINFVKNHALIPNQKIIKGKKQIMKKK